jgi:transposase
MPRYKHYDYNQLVMVPVSLDRQLAPGTLEYAIHQIIEERVDTSIFDEKYRNDETGCTAFSPKILLKIILFAYSRGILHSRRMERACRENIIFMALACGQQPDHSTLAAFVSSMGSERIIDLFTQVLLVCEEEGLLGGTHFSLDGLKLSSNASKEWSGTHAELLKKKEKLEQKVKIAIGEQQKEDVGGEDRDMQREDKRIRRLTRNAERIGKFLEENKPRSGCRGKEKQSNVTDNESAKMISSHGVIQGYNANALVDEKHQVVMHAEAFSEGEDASNMGPMLAGAQQIMEKAGHGPDALKGKIVSADTGFFSKKNIEACNDEEVDAYIPDRGFRNRDPRFAEAQRHRRSVDKHKRRYKSKKRFFTPDDFKIDDRTGRLTCPAGKSLYQSGQNINISGYRGVAYRAPKTACKDCKLRAKCLQTPDAVQRQVRYFHSKPTGGWANEMKRKIDTVEGRRMYGKRLKIVEPVFGNIRAQKDLNRFTLRGRSKINIQWRLYCLVHNIEKILHFGTSFAKAS